MYTEIDFLVQRYPDLQSVAEAADRTCEALIHCFQAGGKVLVCGNGGSAADAEHLVGELMKSYLLPRRLSAERRAALAGAPDGDYLAEHLQAALPAISLVSQTGLLTAVANDNGADLVFAQQVYGYGRAGDVLMAISTSGNSRNVLLAAQVARAQGLTTLGFTGRTGGVLRDLSDVAVCVPHDQTALVQERHLALYHALCAAVERTLFING